MYLNVFLFCIWIRWDYSNRGYLDALKHLTDLKQEGKSYLYELFNFSCLITFFIFKFIYLFNYIHFSKWCVGKIKTVALTNFDTERLQIILENDIPVVSNQVNIRCISIVVHFLLVCIWRISLMEIYQVQHSIVDMRPQQSMAELCKLTGVKLITYLSRHPLFPFINYPVMKSSMLAFLYNQ